MKVLVVDDYPGAAAAAVLLLELLGHECRAAVTGTDALAQHLAFEPDLIILDIGLPDVSGYEVARQIRERDNGRRVFIAAMTGWATPDERIKSLAVGIDTHVLKPPRIEIFERVLGAAAARRLNESASIDPA